MRQDEEFAKQAFSRFLLQMPLTPAAWQDGPDPPDFYLSLGPARFAIEVTRVMEAVNVGSTSLPYHGMAEALRRFTERVETRALAAGVLRGTYALALHPVPDLRSQESQLTQRILEHLANAEATRLDAWTILLDSSRGPIVEIARLSDKGAALCEMIGGTGAKWGAEIVQEASDLILAALAVKADRLKGIGEPCILLLVDSYHYARPDTWRASVAGAGLLTPRFHTIARVHGDYECQLLHSNDPLWHAAA